MTDTPEKFRWLLVRTDAERPTAVWITMRVEALLSHYFQPNISDEADLLAAATWIDVLGDIPKDAVDQAFCEWERTEEKRPTPAGIRRLALTRVAKPEPPEADKGAWDGRDDIIPEAELARRRAMQKKLRENFPMLRRMTTTEGE